MANHLSLQTEPMYVHINKYVKCTFDYLGWSVSDNYIYNEKSPRHSQYSITITSPDITSQEELNSSMRGKEIADIITRLIPISGLPSLNSPKLNSFSNNLEIVDYKSAPNGWSTNYSDIHSTLNGEKNKLIFNVKVEGFCHPSKLEQSPIFDIQHMLEHYDEAKEEIKFLLFLNNSIETANDINVYMLIGKALEIVYAIGTCKEPKWKKDRPIKKYFPELSDILQEITFGNLFTWTNLRKETRHYVSNKKNNLPHDSMSDEERINLYRCSTSLIINVIRQAFGLSRMSIRR